MIQAQNDLYMVVEDSLSNSKGDNTMEGILTGKISRGELVRNAANICRVLMRK
jgi:beta-glucosidase